MSAVLTVDGVDLDPLVCGSVRPDDCLGKQVEGLVGGHDAVEWRIGAGRRPVVVLDLFESDDVRRLQVADDAGRESVELRLRVGRGQVLDVVRRDGQLVGRWGGGLGPR